jgi:hypothetical protein
MHVLFLTTDIRTVNYRRTSQPFLSPVLRDMYSFNYEVNVKFYVYFAVFSWKFTCSESGEKNLEVLECNGIHWFVKLLIYRIRA